MVDSAVKVNRFKRASHLTKTWLQEALREEAPGIAYSRGVDTPTIAEMRSIAERASLPGLLNYETFDAADSLYFNTDSVSFMLVGKPSNGLSEGDLKVLNGLYTQVHKPGTTIQISIVADNNIDGALDSWKKARQVDLSNDNSDIFRRLAEKRVDYFKKGKWESIFSNQSFLFRDYQLIISYNVPVVEGASPYEMGRTEIDDIKRVRDAFIGTLSSAKIYMDELGPSRFINLFFPLLNPDDTKEDTYDGDSAKAHREALKDFPIRRRPFEYDEHQLLRQQLFDSETLFLTGRDGSSLIHGSKRVSVLPWSVKQYPQRWRGDANGELIGSSMDDILRLPCPFIFTQIVHIPDQVSQGGVAQRKSARATQMVDSPMAKFVPQWRERKRDWDYAQTKMQDGSKLLETCYQIVLLAPEGREEYCEQALKSVYGAMGWTLQKDRFLPLHGFLSALPMWTGRNNTEELQKLKRFRSMLSWNAINTAPLIAEYKGSGSPCMLMAGRRGQLAFMDNFDNREGNFNIAVAAASGAGKSFITSEFACTRLSAGGRGFIIDSGRSYEKLCGLLNGSYLDFGKNANVNVNPFTHLVDIEEGMPLLMMLTQEMAGVANDDNVKKSFIEQALKVVWAESGNESTFTLVRDVLASSTDKRARDIAIALYAFTKDGRFGDYFEGPSTINFNNDLVVLELDDLNSKPELQSIVLLILMFNITQSFYMGDRKQRKFCIIDEAWRLLSRGSGAAGEFIEEGYRVARKYGGCFMTITQKIGDYYKSEVAKAAYSNSDWTWLLRQKTEDLVECRENGWLNCGQGRFELFDSLKTDQGKFSEIAMISPAGIGAFRFIVDPFAEKLYSTTAEEYEFVKDLTDKGVPMDDAIEQLVKAGRGR